MKKRLRKKQMKQYCQTLTFRLITAHPEWNTIGKVVNDIEKKDGQHVSQQSTDKMLDTLRAFSLNATKNPHMITKVHFIGILLLGDICIHMGLENTPSNFRGARKYHAVL